MGKPSTICAAPKPSPRGEGGERSEPDEVALKEKLSQTCPLISHGYAVPAFSLERLRRLLHSPGNAPLAHSCFGLTPQGEAFGSLYGAVHSTAARTIVRALVNSDEQVDRASTWASGSPSRRLRTSSFRNRAFSRENCSRPLTPSRHRNGL